MKREKKEKRSKHVKLTYIKITQNRKEKQQYRITLPIRLVEELKWNKGDKLKVWLHNKKPQLEIRKAT